METLLQKLEVAADNVATGVAPSLDDLKKIADLSKAVADARKANTDARNQSAQIKLQTRQLRLERLKSWSTFLVPVVSIVTLLATIIIQSLQLSATRQQNEDTQWRELLSSLNVANKDYAADVTVAPRLLSFLNSERYREQARRISIRLLGQITNEAGFKFLFHTLMASEKDLESIISIARTLTGTKFSIESECQEITAKYDYTKFLGLCDLSLTEKQLREMVRSAEDSTRLYALRRAFNGLSAELSFISLELSQLLKAQYGVSTGNVGASRDVKVNLSDVYIHGGDFSKIDFSGFNMTNTVMNYLRLDGSILVPSQAAGLQMAGTAWWKVDAIDEQLMTTFLSAAFPYYAEGVAYPAGDEPTEEVWRSRVAVLCVPLRELCRPENLKFGKASHDGARQQVQPSPR